MNNNHNATTDQVLHQHLHEEVGQVQQHQQQLLQQNLGFIDKVARIEVQQDIMKQQQDRIEGHLESLHRYIGEEIRSSVGGRINDINTLLVQQQDAQNKIIEIQGRQGQQIEQIQNTLQEFTKIQNSLSDHEIRIKNLEKRVAKMDEMDKARLQSRTSLIVAVIAGGFSLLGTVLAIFLR